MPTTVAATTLPSQEARRARASAVQALRIGSASVQPAKAASTSIPSPLPIAATIACGPNG